MRLFIRTVTLLYNQKDFGSKMDPSGAGTGGQGQCTIDERGPPLTAAFRNTSQEAPRVPVLEDVDCDTDVECGLQPSEAEFRERKAEELVRKTKEQRGWRKVIRTFTPS